MESVALPYVGFTDRIGKSDIYTFAVSRPIVFSCRRVRSIFLSLVLIVMGRATGLTLFPASTEAEKTIERR